jgi:acetolactate decarboxylase
VKPFHRITLAIGLICCLLLTACTSPVAGTVSSQAHKTLYQVSTLNSLSAGNFDGIKTVQEVLQEGDFGLGTFDGLNGEMVLLDGQMYQVKDSGKVEIPTASTKLPFAAVTFFNADRSEAISQAQNFNALKADLDPMILNKDRFYAIRVDGFFNQIQVRSESKQQKPYLSLTDALKNQDVFNDKNVKGTLVGFWCPNDIGTLNVVGYHFHFISDDHSQGGHVLDVSINTATVKLDEISFVSIDLGDDAP